MCQDIGKDTAQQRQRERERRPHSKTNTHDVPCASPDGSNSNNAKTTTKRVSFDDKVTIHQFRRLMTKTRTTMSSASWSWSLMSSNGGSGRYSIGLGRHVQTSVDSLLRMEMTTRTRCRPQQRQPQRLDHRHPRLRLVLPMSSSTTTTHRTPPPVKQQAQAQAQARSRRYSRDDDAAGQHKIAVAMAPQHRTETKIVQLAAIQARQGVVVGSSTSATRQRWQESVDSFGVETKQQQPTTGGRFFCSETADI